eukprot:4304116-Lingulodinium_polyedra.AAC.1
MHTTRAALGALAGLPRRDRRDFTRGRVPLNNHRGAHIMPTCKPWEAPTEVPSKTAGAIQAMA